MKKYNICFVGGPSLIREKISGEVVKFNTRYHEGKPAEEVVSLKDFQLNAGLNSVMNSFNEPCQVVLVPEENIPAEELSDLAEKYGKRIKEENTHLNGSKTHFTLYVVVPDGKLDYVRDKFNNFCDNGMIMGFTNKANVCLEQLIMTYNMFGFKKEEIQK